MVEGTRIMILRMTCKSSIYSIGIYQEFLVEFSCNHYEILCNIRLLEYIIDCLG